MKILHLGRSTRAAGNRGGVEKLAWYLQRTINCDITTVSEWGNIDARSYDCIIADDALANIAASRVDLHKTKVISIIHGAWMEFAIRNGKLKDFQGAAEEQGRVWRRNDITKVAVSKSAAHYAKVHHQADNVHIILNAIDLDVFIPIAHINAKPVVIHAATDYNKEGQGRLGQIAKLCPEFEFRFLSAKIGEEPVKFAQGDMFIQGSFYEGNSFAAIEAMACGLPIVASQAGLFECTNFSDYNIGMTVPWDAKAEDFATALRIVWARHQEGFYNPRRWVLNNASLGKFAANWFEVILHES